MIHRLYLPAAYRDAPGGPAAAESPAFRLAKLIVEYPEQCRDVLRWDHTIESAAQMRVQQIHDRAAWHVPGQDSAHVDADGHGPNWWLREWGVTLPDGYGQGDADNNVEALALGKDDPVVILAQFLASPGHRAFLLGEGWYERQTRIGCGAVETWEPIPQQFIWCVLVV